MVASINTKMYWALDQVLYEHSLIESSLQPMRKLCCLPHLTDEETEAQRGPGDLAGITESIRGNGWIKNQLGLILRPVPQLLSSLDTRRLV